MTEALQVTDYLKNQCDLWTGWHVDEQELYSAERSGLVAEIGGGFHFEHQHSYQVKNMRLPSQSKTDGVFFHIYSRDHSTSLKPADETLNDIHTGTRDVQ